MLLNTKTAKKAHSAGAKIAGKVATSIQEVMAAARDKNLSIPPEVQSFATELAPVKPAAGGA
jgi:hypothetical protein